MGGLYYIQQGFREEVSYVAPLFCRCLNTVKGRTSVLWYKYCTPKGFGRLVTTLAYLSRNVDTSPEKAFAINWSSIHDTSVTATPHPCWNGFFSFIEVIKQTRTLYLRMWASHCTYRWVMKRLMKFGFPMMATLKVSLKGSYYAAQPPTRSLNEMRVENERTRLVTIDWMKGTFAVYNRLLSAVTIITNRILFRLVDKVTEWAS